MILLPLNETTETSPKEPAGRPLYVAPRASAASSMTAAPWAWAIETISSILAGVP